QVSNLSATSDNSGGGGIKSGTFQARGRTVAECVYNLNLLIHKKLFWGHSQVIVFGKSLAEDGINKYLDFFFRNNDISPLIKLIYTDNTAEKVLQSQLGMSILPAMGMEGIIEKQRQEANGMVKIISLQRYIEKMMIPSAATVLPCVTLKEKEKQFNEEDDNLQIVFNGFVVLGENGIIRGSLAGEENRGLQLWLGKFENDILTIHADPLNPITIEMQKWKMKKKWQMTENGPALHLKIKMDAFFREENDAVDYTQKENLEKLNLMTEDMIKQVLQSTWDKSVYLQEDFLFLGESLRRYQYPQWLKMKDNWREEFVKIPIDVDIDCKVRLAGNAYDNFWKTRQTVESFKENAHQ
ncbi:MAG: Ger(x)C family spore germination protein, partial [Clostridiales bacterium]